MNRYLLAFLIVLFIVFGGLFFFGFLVMNTTDSVPIGLYYRKYRSPRVGDYVLFSFDKFQKANLVSSDVDGYKYGIKRVAGFFRDDYSVMCFLVSDSDDGFSSFDFGLVRCDELLPVSYLF